MARRRAEIDKEWEDRRRSVRQLNKDIAREAANTTVDTGARFERIAGIQCEIEAAERRLMFVIPVSLTLIFILLYMAFGSLLDAVVVLSNVLALSLGGIWALMITDTSFFRNPHYHQASDTPQTLDYDFLARVTFGVFEAVVEVLES